MTITPRIILNNVTFHLDHTPVRFNKINLSFETLKYGIIGNNGVGKTTFLRLLCGELFPDEGTIQYHGSISSLLQSDASFPASASIQDVLGIAKIIQALNHVNNGNYAESDLDTVQDQWDIETRIESIFYKLKLWPINLDRLFSSLSGGQKIKVLMAKMLLDSSDFLLLDEPTNNLDKLSRETLYHTIDLSKKGMIIVSHNRTLLNKMDCIIEITSNGIDVYGGNYDFYKEQKQIKRQAIEQEIQARTEILIKSKQAIQTRMERHQQNKSRGRKEKIKQIKGCGSYNKIELKAKKGRSESTNRRIRLQANRKLETVNAELSTARAKLEVQKKLNVNLEKSSVPNNKIIIKIENLCFNYNKQNSLINHFNLIMVGPDRIAVTGPNGCGKSTLIKLIKGELASLQGTINMGVDYIAYFDQEVNFLNRNLTLIDNFLRLNPSLQLFDAYSALAAFNFRNKEVEKKVTHLSSGEKMRAGLAICLMSKQPPQLIILDEPTNHLDLTTIEAIEGMLKLYQGALLVISHDEQFLKNIDIKKTISIQ